MTTTDEICGLYEEHGHREFLSTAANYVQLQRLMRDGWIDRHMDTEHSIQYPTVLYRLSSEGLRLARRQLSPAP